MDIDVSHWGPLQYLAGLGVVIASAVAWWVGNRSKPAPTDDLRQDLEKVISASKQGIYTRIDQVEVSFRAQLDLAIKRFDDRLHEVEFERLRKVEIDVTDRLARVEEQLRFRRPGPE